MYPESVMRREPAMRLDGSWVETAETRSAVDPADGSIVAERGGDDGEYGYERHLRRKTVYVGYHPSGVDQAPSNVA